MVDIATGFFQGLQAGKALQREQVERDREELVRISAQAQAAFDNGDVEGASNLIAKAYDYVPDGGKAYVVPKPQGVAVPGVDPEEKSYLSVYNQMGNEEAVYSNRTIPQQLKVLQAYTNPQAYFQQKQQLAQRVTTFNTQNSLPRKSIAADGTVTYVQPQMGDNGQVQYNTYTPKEFEQQFGGQDYESYQKQKLTGAKIATEQVTQRSKLAAAAQDIAQTETEEVLRDPKRRKMEAEIKKLEKETGLLGLAKSGDDAAEKRRKEIGRAVQESIKNQGVTLLPGKEIPTAVKREVQAATKATDAELTQYFKEAGLATESGIPVVSSYADLKKLGTKESSIGKLFKFDNNLYTVSAISGFGRKPELQQVPEKQAATPEEASRLAAEYKGKVVVVVNGTKYIPSEDAQGAYRFDPLGE